MDSELGVKRTDGLTQAHSWTGGRVTAINKKIRNKLKKMTG